MLFFPAESSRRSAASSPLSCDVTAGIWSGAGPGSQVESWATLTAFVCGKGVVSRANALTLSR